MNLLTRMHRTAMTAATARPFVGIHASAGMIMGVVEAVIVAVVLMMINEDIEEAIGEVEVDFVVETGDTKMIVEIVIISETEIVVIEVHRHDQGEADLGVLQEDTVAAVEDET